MFDNKNSNWSKSKNVSAELQTKQQVQEEMLKQVANAEEQQQKSRDDNYRDRDKGGKYGDKRGGKPDQQIKQVYAAKTPSTTSDSKG